MTPSKNETGRDSEHSAVPPASRSRWGSASEIRAQVRSVNTRVNERSGRNLAGAIGIGLILGGALVAALLFDKRWFIPLGTALVIAVVVELATAMRLGRRRVPRIPSAVVAAVVVPLAYFVNPATHWILVGVGILLVILWRLVEAQFERPRPARHQLAVDASSSAFVHFYVTFLGSFTLMLLAQPLGQYWVLTFVAVVVAVDTGAYATGLRFGRTKLAPRISPSKTWEGLGGGVVLGVAVAIAACELLLGLPWWFGIIMGITLTIAAVAGDLTESMIKRDLGVKDMSNWLPGHGGFFDRFDSLLPAGAIAFALYFWSTPIMEFAQRLG